jgi:hypothetical protein
MLEYGLHSMVNGRLLEVSSWEMQAACVILATWEAEMRRILVLG